MNLPALYDLLATRVRAGDVIDLPTWGDIAAAAEVDPLDDAAALRSLIEKGAVDRHTIRNTFGDCAYILRRPLPEFADAFRAALRTSGASVRNLTDWVHA